MLAGLVRTWSGCVSAHQGKHDDSSKHRGCGGQGVKRNTVNGGGHTSSNETHASCHRDWGKCSARVRWLSRSLVAIPGGNWVHRIEESEAGRRMCMDGWGIPFILVFQNTLRGYSASDLRNVVRLLGRVELSDDAR